MRLAILIGAIALYICQNTAIADEVPAFFLKIAKIPTLPRVGRSGRVDNFFYKAEKNIPRIGRNSQVSHVITTVITIILYSIIVSYLYDGILYTSKISFIVT